MIARRATACVALVFLGLYASLAFDFYRQERWAHEPLEAWGVDVERVKHPEATLGLLRYQLDDPRYRGRQLPLLNQALRQAPSFYQSAFLLAAHRARTMEPAVRVRAPFEAALSRYPTNGRLHLAYAEFLLEARGTLDGWQGAENAEGLVDPLPRAEEAMRRAMELEPNLAMQAMNALIAFHVPPNRWREVVTDDPMVQRSLIDALFQAEHHEAGLALLQEQLQRTEDLDLLRYGAGWALMWDAPKLALQAAVKWLEAEERLRGPGPGSLQAALTASRAHLALGQSDAADRILLELIERVEKRYGPGSRLTLQTLCEIGNEYARLGQSVTAESLFSQASLRSPSYVPAILGLARTYAKLGDQNAAISHYEEILRLDADHAEATRELKAMIRTIY